MFQRKLQIALPEKQSAFLWGPRQTGKSHYLKTAFKEAIYYDLLDTNEVARLTKNPSLLREELLAVSESELQHPVIIDEVQKIPALLNEVHWLIENKGVQFILCGSSARKLKTQATNLLGGRAWVYHFHPLVWPEIPDFDLLHALQHGLLPKLYLSKNQYLNNHFQAYLDSYFIDEVRNEGLVRNLSGFARFLDAVGMTNGQMINVNNIARDCGIDRSTVQGYYQILIDTWLGYYIYPYQKKVKRDIITATPKFYLFDIGVANYIRQQNVSSLKGAIAGQSFEHYILMELQAYLSFSRQRASINYWRTKTGLEVDFILGDAKAAIEVKISEQVHQADLKGLIAFCEEFPNTQPIVVSQAKRARKLQVNDNIVIDILPWKTFLKRLWNHEILIS